MLSLKGWAGVIAGVLAVLAPICYFIDYVHRPVAGIVVEKGYHRGHDIPASTSTVANPIVVNTGYSTISMPVVTTTTTAGGSTSYYYLTVETKSGRRKMNLVEWATYAKHEVGEYFDPKKP